MARELDALIGEIRQHAEAQAPDLLIDAVRRFIGNAVAAGIPVSPEQCRFVLDALQGVRAFTELTATADQLIRIGHDAPIVQIRYAQGLVDSGRPVAAIAALERLLAVIEPSHPDRALVLGLMGRANKQIYVDHRAPVAPASVIAALKRAIGHYSHAFDPARIPETYRYGINLVALLARAARDGVPGFTPDLAVGLARRIDQALTPIAEPGRDDPWLYATLGEAAVAEAEWTRAQRWYMRFAAHPKIVAFMVASALRQLRQVWQIEPDSAQGGLLIAMLKARLLGFEDGAVNVTAGDRIGLAELDTGLDGIAAEAIFGHDAPFRIDWLRAGLMAARSVGRIRDRHSRETHGTGFLLRGSELHASLGADLLLLTNSHVLSDGSEASALLPDFAEVVFEEAGLAQPYACREIVWQSPVAELDAALVRLVGDTTRLSPLQLAPFDYLPERAELLPESRRRAIVIGHPGGQELAVSLADTRILDLGYRRKDKPHNGYVHYRTPTLAGSSGSPVFEAGNWQVIAMHHGAPAGRGGLRKLAGKVGFNHANEGVLMRSIAQAVKRDHRPRWFTPQTVAQPGEAEPDTGSAGIAHKLTRLDVPERELKAHLAVDLESSEAFVPCIVSATAPKSRARTPAPPGDADAPEAAKSLAPERTPAAVIESFNRIARWRRQQRYRQRIESGWSGLRFVSEGDSWFQYPFMLEDVIDQLFEDHAIFCLAGAGHTLQSIAASGELIEAITREQPHGVLLSGGGNDLLSEGTIRAHLKDYDPSLSPAAYAEPSLSVHMQLIAEFYDGVIRHVLKAKADVQIFCHGYDWALPDPNKGSWLARPMSEKGIGEPALQRALVRLLIDRFNETMAALQARHPGVVHFVDCRGAVGGAERWYDELHPTDLGFSHVAERFRRRIAEAFGRA